MRISDWSSDVCSSDLRNVTAEGWFRLDRPTNTWMPIVSKGLNNTSPYRIAVNSSGAIWGAVRDGSGLETVQSAGGVVPFGEWVHLALVADRDAGTLVLYVRSEESLVGKECVRQ